MNYCHPWKVWNALWASSQLDAIVHLSIRSDKLLFRPIRNLVSDLKSNFLMEKTVTTVIFRKMTSTEFSTPLYLSPSRWTRDGKRGERWGDLHRGRCHGKTRNITGFCRMVVMNYPELREISPDRSPGRWL